MVIISIPMMYISSLSKEKIAEEFEESFIMFVF